MRRGLGQGSQHKSLVCCVAQENSEEESDTESEKEATVEKDTQVTAEEKLKEVDLGTDLQKPRPISLSSKLPEDEKAELILLFKEFRDVFAWDYNKILGLDLGLVVLTLNINPKSKPVAQPAKVFYTEIEEHIVKEVQKLLLLASSNPSKTRDGCPILC